MSAVCVCMLVHGSDNYYRAARRSIRSILKRSPFDIYVACDESRSDLLPDSKRIIIRSIERKKGGIADRASSFLLKFEALAGCLQDVDSEWLLLLDADTLLASQIHERHIQEALEQFPLAMVEQTGIRGSSMNRIDFLNHYKNHTLAWFASNGVAPDADRFRFFNSGVVLGNRTEFTKLVPWALGKIRSAATNHEIGIHMIADQDYFQYWANTLHPGVCRSLPWHWNHCEYWDSGFPREGAIFYHFSNFCKGPTRKILFRMSWLDFKARRRHATR